MQVNGVIERFSVHPILMLTHLHSPETGSRQEKRRKDQSSEGFNSILTKQMMTVKAVP